MSLNDFAFFGGGATEWGLSGGLSGAVRLGFWGTVLVQRSSAVTLSTSSALFFGVPQVSPLSRVFAVVVGLESGFGATYAEEAPPFPAFFTSTGAGEQES